MSSYFKKPHQPTEYEMYAKLSLYVPQSLFDAVKEESAKRAIPMSKLITFAIDNELDQSVPFAYDSEWPKDPYKEDQYIEQATKVLKMIRTLPGGLPKDALLLLRRDMELSREEVLQGLRELLEKQIVQEYKNPKAKFKYASDYYHYRIKPDPVENRRKGWNNP